MSNDAPDDETIPFSRPNSPQAPPRATCRHGLDLRFCALCNRVPLLPAVTRQPRRREHDDDTDRAILIADLQQHPGEWTRPNTLKNRTGVPKNVNRLLDGVPGVEQRWVPRVRDYELRWATEERKPTKP